MGFFKVNKPKGLKEFVRPAYMIKPPADAFSFAAPPEDAPQAPTDPLVQRAECGFVAVFEIFKPARHRDIHGTDNGSQTVAVAAAGLLAHGVFKLLQAFPPRPASNSPGATAPFKVIAEEIKSIPCYEKFI